MLANIEASMRDLDVAEVASHDVTHLRDAWRDKPRTTIGGMYALPFDFAYLSAVRARSGRSRPYTCSTR